MRARIRQALLRSLASALILLEASSVWAHAMPVRQTPVAGIPGEIGGGPIPPTLVAHECDGAGQSGVRRHPCGGNREPMVATYHR